MLDVLPFPLGLTTLFIHPLTRAIPIHALQLIPILGAVLNRRPNGAGSNVMVDALELNPHQIKSAFVNTWARGCVERPYQLATVALANVAVGAIRRAAGDAAAGAVVFGVAGAERGLDERGGG